jgi:hypothetical protein
LRIFSRKLNQVEVRKISQDRRRRRAGAHKLSGRIPEMSDSAVLNQCVLTLQIGLPVGIHAETCSIVESVNYKGNT